MSKSATTKMCQTTIPSLPTLPMLPTTSSPVGAVGDGYVSTGSSVGPPSSWSNGYIHVTAKDSDSDTEIEDYIPDCDRNNLRYSQSVCCELERFVSKDSKLNGSHKHPKSSNCRTNLAVIPDLNGVRFCRVCEDFLPITEFPRGQRRYTCKLHLWERTGRKAKKTLLMKPRKKLLSRMWMQCYKDRAVFGQDRVELTQADIDTLLDTEPCMQKSVSISAPGQHIGEMGLNQTDSVNTANATEAANTIELTVLPKDPNKPLSKENAMLASREARRQLLELMLQKRRCASLARDGVVITE